MTIRVPYSLAIACLLLSVSMASRADDCGCFSSCPATPQSSPFPDPVCMSQCDLQCSLSKANRSSSSTAPKPPEVFYGAIARSSAQRVASVYLQLSAENARQKTLELCRKDSPGASCTVINEFHNTCAAVFSHSQRTRHLVVVGTNGAGMSKAEARDLSRARCDASGGCEETLYVCSTVDEFVERREARAFAAASAVMDIAASVFNSGTPGRPRYDSTPNTRPETATSVLRSRTFEVNGNGGSGLMMAAPFPDEQWGPSLTPGGPNLFAILFRLPTNRKYLVCDYQGARQPGMGASTESFAFWYQEPIEDIEKLFTIDSNNSLRFLGTKAYSECPATFGEALAARQLAIDYSNSPELKQLRERMAADITARKKAPR